VGKLCSGLLLVRPASLVAVIVYVRSAELVLPRIVSIVLLILYMQHKLVIVCRPAGVRQGAPA
jgi:hypothetical protein